MCPGVCNPGKHSPCKYDMLKAEPVPDMKLAQVKLIRGLFPIYVRFTGDVITLLRSSAFLGMCLFFSKLIFYAD